MNTTQCVLEPYLKKRHFEVPQFERQSICFVAQLDRQTLQQQQPPTGTLSRKDKLKSTDRENIKSCGGEDVRESGSA